MNVAKQISWLALACLLGIADLRAEVLPDGATNAAVTSLLVAAPTTNPVLSVTAESTNSAPAARILSDSGFAASSNVLLWLGLAFFSTLSVGAIILSWRVARHGPTSTAIPSTAENPPEPASQYLPLISLTVKETLAQRRELLTSQQAATTELAQPARRLEPVKKPEPQRQAALRNGTARPPTNHREIPVKIYCECGQKYSFEVRPVDGQMPFPVACPSCGLDGTAQANKFFMKILSAVTQPIPTMPRRESFSSTQSAFASLPMEPVHQTTEKISVIGQRKANGVTTPENHTEDCVAELLVEGGRLMEANEFESALKCFDTALTLRPEHAETFLKMGGALDKLGRVDEAIRCFDSAIVADNAQTVAYLLKAGLFHRLGRYEEAAKCYEQALLKQKQSAT